MACIFEYPSTANNQKDFISTNSEEVLSIDEYHILGLFPLEVIEILYIYMFDINSRNT